MRLDNTKREVSSSGMMQVAKATIKATPKIFDMFANDTYANKPLAILRELVANGVDAHVMAGRADRPVEVVLPTVYDPTCRIRDFGTGMEHDFVMGPFMAYTDGSTKDKSDDAIGGFGIGSKSPFAYVDQYTLRVVHEGVLSVYTMMKDEDGIPAVGLQAQTTTDEPNGVEISFPVEDADIETFATAAQEALQFFQPLPLVTNGTLNGPDYTYRGNGWAMRPKGGELGVIMGGVRYPAVASSMSYELRTDPKISPLLSYGLDLTMPIGSCGVAMSREALSYTPKTSAAIKAALEGLVDDVVKTFSNFFDNCESEWDAMELLDRETQIGQGQYVRSGRAQLLLSNAKYKGQPLNSSFSFGPESYRTYDLKNGRGWWIDPQRSRRGVNCPAPKWIGLHELYSITPGLIETVIIDDLPQSPKSKAVQRIRAYIDEQPQVKRTLVVRADDAAKLFEALRRPSNVVYSSTMPEPSKNARTKYERPRVRMFRFTGATDRFTHAKINNLTPAHSKTGIVSEVPYAVQPQQGIMVVMNSFDLPSDFYDKMSTGLLEYDELVFVNITDESKLEDSFENFDKAFKQRLKVALSAYPELPQRLAVMQNPVMQNYDRKFSAIQGRYSELSKAALSRPFGRLFTAWMDYVKPLDRDQRKLGHFVEAKLPTGFRPDDLQKRLWRQQLDVSILLERLDLSSRQHVDLLIKNL